MSALLLKRRVVGMWGGWGGVLVFAEEDGRCRLKRFCPSSVESKPCAGSHASPRPALFPTPPFHYLSLFLSFSPTCSLFRSIPPYPRPPHNPALPLFEAAFSFFLPLPLAPGAVYSYRSREPI